MATDIGVLGSPFFQRVILPFLLIFVVVFAILEKTAILGKERRQVNAIVSFVFALIFVSVPYAVAVTTDVIPIVAISIVIILAFMLVIGFIGGTEKGGLSKGLRVTVGIVFGITLIITVLWATGGLPYIKRLGEAEQFWPTLILIAFIIAVFSVVLTAKPSPEEKPERAKEATRERAT